MAGLPRPHWGLHWHSQTKPARRDPAAEQLRRDRLTAVITFGIVAVILAVIITLVAMSGLPSVSDAIDPWTMIP